MGDGVVAWEGLERAWHRLNRRLRERVEVMVLLLDFLLLLDLLLLVLLLHLDGLGLEPRADVCETFTLDA